jgi:alkanesulfonate monooxygenase SsuD/methylene tetrahydromethanopterin reductase-like flavin-dependent oxidoreductase (luciferase family)
MILDASLPPVPLKSIPEIARGAEAIGFSALWSTETIHDPFLPGPLIAEHSQRLCFGTAIAVAFARSPATLAYSAWDLAQASGGRFILGLGTQVKAHIERRFGMPWPDSVVGKLREQIAALRAFWNSWQTGAALDFRGQYYRLSLMTPFFNPGPIEHPQIPIYIAGVNPGLARLAGETAQGFLSHPFHTPQYLSNVLLPVTSPEEDLFVRSQIAFYASTPSYKAVMAYHGWQETAEQLSNLARFGRWGEMPALVSDEMLAACAVVCPPDELGRRLKDRYAGLADRLGLYLPFIPGQRDEFWQTLVRQVAG